MEHISCPTSEWPLNPFCPSISLSILSLFCCPHFLYLFLRLSPSLLPSSLALSASHMYSGVVNTMSFFPPQCSAGCQYRRWTPSRQLCLCWALWFTVRGHSPQTGNLWKLPFWQPSPEVSFEPPNANQSTETGNEGTSYASLLCAVVNHWPCSPLQIFLNF